MQYGAVLEDILSAKKILIESQKKQYPASEIEKKIQTLKDPENFKKIFKKDTISLIAEIKRSSAASGNINANLNVLQTASDFIESGASAISVLTEKTKFSGDLIDLNDISEYLRKRRIPILQKDFIIDEYQIIQGRMNGASAILIIVSILANSMFKKIIEKCNELKITPLVEIFNEDELEVALESNINVIGINNRNLKNLETSLKVFENLAPKIPKDKFLIAESGLKSKSDVERMASYGADAVLIGESLLKEKKGLRDLVKQLSSVKKCK